jgi:hypothetical protein
MWHWDQGHLEYFQFDNLRKIAQFAMQHDFKHAFRDVLNNHIGLPFAAPDTHDPWRNYSRILRLMLLVRIQGNKATPTAVAEMLATPGTVTCDEYLHFIASVFTEPCPALKGWNPNFPLRYPLLFTLKYLLIKLAVKSDMAASFDEILGAYSASGYRGDEDQTHFISLLNVSASQHENVGSQTPRNLRRQARESLLVLAQISYLHVHQHKLIVSLDKDDAMKIFEDLEPLAENSVADREQELNRRAELFSGGSTYNDFDYSSTIVNEIVESGFLEGGRIKRTHIAIERNSGIREEYFSINPNVTCDVCGLDTKATYPWTKQLIIDLHHLLPLASGTRVEMSGTTFADLIPVCPTCHRATHRFYDYWLAHNNRTDFIDRDEARNAYHKMKTEFRGLASAPL